MLFGINRRSRGLTVLFFLFLVSCKTNTPLPEYTHRTQPEKQELEYDENLIRIYRLKKFQDYEFEERFKNKIESIYQKTYDEYQTNFTYKIVPSGVIYSFSEVTIICVPDKRISKSYKACHSFFKSIDEYYHKLKTEELK
jgi:hypothetical protein